MLNILKSDKNLENSTNINREESNIPKSISNITVAFAIIIASWGAIQMFSSFLISGEEIFGKSISNDSTFYINLEKDNSYQLKLEDINGNPGIKIVIWNGSYIALDDTFNENGSEGATSIHKKFNVEENGTYQINVKMFDSGSFRLEIERYNSSWI